MDFTLKIYRQLLVAIQNKGYSFFTFEEYCQKKTSGNFVMLRHDVDLRARLSLATAKIEAALGIRASYYFRVVPQSNQPDIIRAIAALGHEIGYHYDDMALFNGDAKKALAHFQQQLEYFRQFYPIQTICMHGSPTSKHDNKDLWKNGNYRDYGIIGEPYFDVDFNKVFYLTDTGRMWDGLRYNVRDKVVLHRRDVPIHRECAIKYSMGSGEFIDNSSKHILDSEDYKPQMKLATSRLGVTTNGACDITQKQNSKQQTTFHSTTDIIHSIQSGTFPSQVMITTHPQRWTDNRVEWIQELILQQLKNVLKKILVGSK